MGTPTISPPEGHSCLARNDDDEAQAHGQQEISKERDRENTCDLDQRVNGAVEFAPVPHDQRSNQTGTLLPNVHVHDASSNRECCGAASR